MKDEDNDWGHDKSRRERRFKQKSRFKKDRELPKDLPSRIDSPRRRRNHIEWHGNDFDYQEEYGEE